MWIYSFPNTIYSETTLSPLCVIGHLVKDFTVVVQLLSHVWLFVTPWTAAHQALLSFTISWSLLKLMSIESVTQLPLLCYPFSPALSLSHHHGLFQWISTSQSIGASASEINWPYMYDFISGFFILFHWSMCLFLYQNHNLLITVAL